MTTSETYNHIIDQKTKSLNEKNFNVAAVWRQKEVDFMMENYGIDIRSDFVKKMEKNLDSGIVGIIKE